MKPFLRTKLMHSHLLHPHFKNLTDTVVNIATALEIDGFVVVAEGTHC